MANLIPPPFFFFQRSSHPTPILQQPYAYLALFFLLL